MIQASSRSVAAKQTLQVTIRLLPPHEKQKLFLQTTAKRIIIRAGRRSGKTTGIARLAVRAFLAGKRVLYAAPTLDQVEQFWFTVTDALKDAIEQHVYYKNESRHLIELRGTRQRIRAKTAWNADTLRGDFADLLLLDEAQLMREDAIELVGLPMLADNNGDLFMIYTPPSIESIARTKARDPQFMPKLYKKYAADTSGRYAAFSFTSFDNPHISRQAVEELAKDMSSVAYRMEILAEDVEEAPSALWHRADIEADRVLQSPPLAMVVVGVDPSETSTGDEAGIVVSGVDRLKEYYVLADHSLQGSPLQWAKEAIKAYYQYQADYVVAEGNAGGDMVKTIIHQIDPAVPVKMVWASRGKTVRATPVSTKAAQHKVHHIGSLPKLEDELCLWIPTSKSPNRLDAMVHSIAFLMDNGIVKKANSRQG